MRTITSPKVAVALAALLLGGTLASAPEARAGSDLNGLQLNGVTLNGQKPQGSNLNGREINGERMQDRPTSGDAAETAGMGALQVRSVRLPGGRTLLAGQR